ncbi:MAG: peptidoglycan -binding protein [Rhodospirillaceae bacterium]|nr:peptidoglycan -binding protein [Rhodospirillaceae bacterium]
MPGLSTRYRHRADIWPGFVDALASLLMVIIFLLLVFVLAQFFLGEALSGRENALQKLDREMAEMAELLALEKNTSKSLRGDVSRLSGELQASILERDRLNEGLAEGREKISGLSADIEKLNALKAQLENDIGKLAANLDEKETALLAEQEISTSARAEIALLNQQLGAMKDQIATLNKALDASEQKAKDQNVQIVALGKRLNAALAGKVQELSEYRSDFFGRLKIALGDHPGIRIVGDRFVFQSEVLFASGETDIGETGLEQISRLAETLKDVSARIPEDVDWVLRVDGHTDMIPIQNERFHSNWELSAARSISVVKKLIASGIPANRLVAAGFGEFQPIDKGSNDTALRRNRRIELKLTGR